MSALPQILTILGFLGLVGLMLGLGAGLGTIGGGNPYLAVGLATAIAVVTLVAGGMLVFDETSPALAFTLLTVGAASAIYAAVRMSAARPMMRSTTTIAPATTAVRSVTSTPQVRPEPTPALTLVDQGPVATMTVTSTPVATTTGTITDAAVQKPPTERAPARKPAARKATTKKATAAKKAAPVRSTAKKPTGAASAAAGSPTVKKVATKKSATRRSPAKQPAPPPATPTD